jgi:hypothetical protein
MQYTALLIRWLFLKTHPDYQPVNIRNQDGSIACVCAEKVVNGRPVSGPSFKIFYGKLKSGVDYTERPDKNSSWN